jgi:hypothetical protein
MDIEGEWFLGVRQVEGQGLEKAPERGVDRSK